MRKLFSVLVILAGCAAVWNMYGAAFWTPNWMTKREVRRAIGESDRISAGQARDDISPYLEQAARERRIDIGDVREKVLVAARRAGELKALNEDATAAAEGGRRLPSEETVAPPPPPKPARPAYERIEVHAFDVTEPVIGLARYWYVPFVVTPSSWHGPTRKPVPFVAPTLVRIAGTVRVDGVSSGPGGVAWPSKGYSGAVRPLRDPTPIQPSAPYLGLLARVCNSPDSREESLESWDGQVEESPFRCTAAFPVGAHSVVCPDVVGMTGEMQFTVNRYMSRADESSGAFTIEISEAPPGSCGSSRLSNVAKEVELVAENQLFRKRETRVLASAPGWKPFWMSLDEPVVITAQGQIQENDGSPLITGPAGGEPPDWARPTSLLAPGLPYYALVGRVCKGDRCSRPFVVGDGGTVCPQPADRIELAYNHDVRRRFFEGMKGAYRFKFSRGAASGCGR